MLPEAPLVNTERLQAAMVDRNLDAVIATAPENVTYLSGFWALPQWIRRGPQAYVVWPAAPYGDAEIITSTSTLDLVADQQIAIKRVRRFGEFHIHHHCDVAMGPVSQRQMDLCDEPDHGDAIGALLAALCEADLTHARIGIDEIGLMPGQLEKLKIRLPDAVFLSSADLFRHVRAVKTPEEIVRLARIAEITERSIEAALSIAREGVTELDLARAFHSRTVQDDAFPVLGCIGFGERSALMNVQPSERQLRKGDVIRFDVGGRYRHYRADVARIATFGEPTTEVRLYHRALLAGVDRACTMSRPGVRTADIFEAIIETVRREGISHYQRNHVGHGIGLDGYDAPTLAPGSSEVLEDGMVLCVETPYYEFGRLGLQVEDMVVVRADGVDRLTTTSGDLWVIEP